MGYQNQQPIDLSNDTSTHIPIHFMPNDEEASVSELSRTKVVMVFLIAFAAAAGFAAGATTLRSGDVESAGGRTISLELEGKKMETKYDSSDNTLSCADGKYSKRTLKLAYELPFASLFRDHKGQRKYEASSIIVVDNDAYAVCDSSWAISKFGANLQPFGVNNLQIGEVIREKDESGFEAIFHDAGTFFVVRESIQSDDKTYHAIIEELEMNGLAYEIKDQCPAEFEFEGSSKGFEGAIAVRDLNNEMVVLGLCEGNHCSEKKKKKNDKGHGRLVAMRKKIQTGPDGTTSCQWVTIRTIHIPSSAMFRDYSDISMTDAGKVGITSQEDSQLWVGQLNGQTPAGLWDVDQMEFDKAYGSVFDFPKNDSCQTVYCNIEGVDWINDGMIIAVSDKMKGRGKQDFRCFEKDQSVHVFVLPN